MKQKIDIILIEMYKTLLDKYNCIGLLKLWMEVTINIWVKALDHTNSSDVPEALI